MVTEAAVDEEVVIDRYAALDSAIDRLTRTMLTVRANVRPRAADPIVLPEPPANEAISLAALDAVHQRFDVVLPEDDPIEAKAMVLESSRQTVTATVPAVAAVAAPAPAVRETPTRRRGRRASALPAALQRAASQAAPGLRLGSQPVNARVLLREV